MTFNGESGLYYTRLDPGSSSWQPPSLVSPHSAFFEHSELIATTDGKVHLIWGEYNSQQRSIKYRGYTPGSGWSNVETPFVPPQVVGAWGIFYAVNQGADGSLHFLSFDYPMMLYYFQRSASGFFTTPQAILHLDLSPESTYITMTPDNQPQIFWATSSNNGSAVLQYSNRQITGQDGMSTLSQTFTIPGSMQNPGLSFMYRVDGPAGGGSDFKVTVTDGTGTSTVFTAPDENNGYQHTWVDMSQWKGEQVTLTFSMSYHQGQPVPEALVDEVSLGETYPDGWVSLSPGERHALPGQEVTLTLRYGAHGLPLDQAVLSAQLPAGMEFVSASVAPDSIGDTLTWNLGELDPADGDQVIRLVVRVKADSAAFQTFNLSVSLASPTVELETANNSAQTSIRSEAASYLPIAYK